MSSPLVWLGSESAPDVVSRLATHRGAEFVTVTPDKGLAEVTTHRPGVVVAAAVSELGAARTAAPEAVLVYAPETTSPDAVSEAVAAGTDVVLPQDADAWGVATLATRIDRARADGPRPPPAVPAGESRPQSSLGVATGDPAGSATSAREGSSQRREPNGVLTVDEAGTISAVGDHAAELLRRDADDLLGRRLDEALPFADVGRLASAHTELKSDGDSISVVERLMPENRWLEFIARRTAEGATVTVQTLDPGGRREVVLDGLHGVTRRLFDAETKEAVAALACEATRDVLGLEAVGVRLHDDGELRLAAKSNAVSDLMPDRPTYAADEGMAGAAFESGQPQIRTELGDEGFGAIRSSMCLPLGRHGTLSIGSVAPSAFDEDDVALAKLLSTTVTAALDRTERERQLRRREAVLESVRGMFFVLDADRKVDYLTESLAQRLGASREEITGRHVIEFIDITDFYRADSLFDAIEAADDGVSIPMQITPVEGEQFHAEVELSRLAGAEEAVVGVIEDRSALVETRDDLERERERLWTLFENLPDPVVETEHVDGTPVIRTVNDAFSEVFGHAPDAVVDRPLDEVLVPPADERGAGPEAETINKRVDGGEVTGEKVRRETVNGSRSFLFRGIPYTQGGGTRAFAIYTDVTDIERREHHAKVLDRLLRHNLRNELGLILGYAENIASNAAEPGLRSDAESLVRVAEELVELSDTAKRIRHIIDSPDADRVSVSVDDLFAGVVAETTSQFPTLGIETRCSEPSLAVRADEHLRIALEELVENVAVHGGNSVVLQAEPVPAVPESWVDIRVIDDGSGIPAAERDAVTGERSITQLDHGSGLGLWLVRWAVESVGGDLAFEQTTNQTVVRLRLRRDG